CEYRRICSNAESNMRPKLLHIMLTRATPGGSQSSDEGGSREAKRIKMRLSWSTQVIAVLGSLTAGEMALSAMSTICKTPNSTSCCKVREGPKSNALRSSVVPCADNRSPLYTLRNGTPSGMNWPTRLKTWTFTLQDFAVASSRWVSI